MAERSNASNYLDCVLSCPGLLELNQDILAYRWKLTGFQNKVPRTGNVLEMRRLISLS